MTQRHQYEVTVTWTGNTGTGTSGYRDYSRSHMIEAAGKDAIAGSSDPAFRGEPNRWSPEELLLASLSACHKLWFLHLCADAGLVVSAYVDRAEGTMRTEAANGTGRFTDVLLKPEVTIGVGGDSEVVQELHEKAHKRCFIANSVNFPVRCQPTLIVAETAAEEQVSYGR